MAAAAAPPRAVPTPPTPGPYLSPAPPRLIVGFSAGNGLFDRIIRAVECGLEHDRDAPQPLATHVWLEAHRYTWDGEQAVGIEAVAPHVRMFDPATKHGAPGTIRRYRLPCTPGEVGHAWTWARMHLGDGYDYAGIAKCLFYLLTGQIDRFYDDHTARVFCSELAVSSLRAGGIAVLDGLAADDVTPCHLERWAAAHGQPVP